MKKIIFCLLILIITISLWQQACARTKTLEFIGVVESQDNTTVPIYVDSYIRELYELNGKKVRKGQRIAKLWSVKSKVTYSKNLLKYLQAYHHHKKELAKLKIDKKLYRRNALARRSYEYARDHLFAAEFSLHEKQFDYELFANLLKAKPDIDNISDKEALYAFLNDKSLGEFEIKAPVSGVLLFTRDLDVNSTIIGHESPIVIADPDKLKVVSIIPASIAKQLQQGMDIKVTNSKGDVSRARISKINPHYQQYRRTSAGERLMEVHIHLPWYENRHFYIGEITTIKGVSRIDDFFSSDSFKAL